MSWYKVTLADTDMSSATQLQTAFMALFTVSRLPREAAMFDNLDVAEGHHIYFSPKAAEFCMPLIARWRGRPCDKPRSEDLSLLVGHSDAREVLLHEALDEAVARVAHENEDRNRMDYSMYVDEP